MINLINQWERKAKKAMAKGHRSLNDEGEATQYAKALAYCDCITNFTDDESRWDCQSFDARNAGRNRSR